MTQNFLMTPLIISHHFAQKEIHIWHLSLKWSNASYNIFKKLIKCYNILKGLNKYHIKIHNKNNTKMQLKHKIKCPLLNLPLVNHLKEILPEKKGLDLLS